MQLRTALLTWYAKHGRTTLPWRRNHAAYEVTVSEFMLQQTTVAAVIPYFERWLMRFPGFAELAAADEPEVLSAWEGLGYYSRARNLHRLAREIVTHYSGKMPRDLAAIRALPGVGDYTAGAIASFVFDEPVPALDANIGRVLARLQNCHEPVGSRAFREQLTQFAGQILLSNPGGRIINSALMDLGATVCLARKPQCLICPVRDVCRADEPELLPVKPRKTIYEDRDDHRLLIRQDDRILLRQSPGPTWRGMWLFPPAPAAFSRAESIYRAKYSITRFRVTLQIWPADFSDLPSESDEIQQWFSLSEAENIPMPAPYRKAIQRF